MVAGALVSLPAAAQPGATPPTAPQQVAVQPSQQPAVPPPRVSTFPRPSPAPAAPAEPREPRKPGAMLGVAIGLGTDSTFMLDGRIGAVVHPNVALFAEAFGVATAESGGVLLGGGARFMTDWVFLDARVGRISVGHSCDFDDPCTTDTAVGAVVGAGLELYHGPYGGFELRVDTLHAFGDTLVTASLGGSLYIF